MTSPTRRVDWPASRPRPAEVSRPVRLIVVRHGETDWNAEGRIQGHTDIPLSGRGEAQARRLTARLAHEPISIAYASDLQRAWRTAELALEGRDISVVRDPAWRELRFGEWEGLTSAETVVRDPEIAGRRRRHPATVAPPGGEHLGDLRARIAPAISMIAARHPGQTVLVATHGGVVRALGCHLLGMDLDLAWRLGVSNTGVAVVDIWPDGPVVEKWNDTAHLDGIDLEGGGS